MAAFDPGFYETAAAAIPVLVLAVVVDLRTSNSSDVSTEGTSPNAAQNRGRAATKIGERKQRVGRFADFIFLLLQLTCASVGEVAAFRIIDVGGVESPWLRVAVLIGLIASGIVLVFRVLERAAPGKAEAWIIRSILTASVTASLIWTFFYR